ncbi:MAG: SMC-Scp complex subunit ScpB [Candidatus Methylacidiphilales bacterium]|nr:SMC-Scp complex subunit ScpB [Candidatus Methylacidiphilales bacterium]
MELHRVIEALLFASDKPLQVKRIHTVLKSAAENAQSEVTMAFSSLSEKDIRKAIDKLDRCYEEAGCGLTVLELQEGYQLRTRPRAAPWVRELFDGPKPARISQPALETLAVVAYRQPISRSEMEAVRGVAVDGVVASLLERRLIRIAGRSEGPGRPLLYETTPEFLIEFGLRSLKDLPNADELRRLSTPQTPPENPNGVSAQAAAASSAEGESHADAPADAAKAKPSKAKGKAKPKAEAQSGGVAVAGEETSAIHSSDTEARSATTDSPAEQ